MDRFEIVSSCKGPGNHGIAQRIQGNGHWVKYVDVEPMIAALRAALQHVPDNTALGKTLRCDIERLVNR